jgi:hypothetical protein
LEKVKSVNNFVNVYVCQIRAFRSFDDRATQFSLDGELKLGILAGLITISGSANFLSDKQQSYDTQFVAAVYEKSLSDTSLLVNELGEPDYPSVIERTSATHMVTGIRNKTKVIITFEHMNRVSKHNFNVATMGALGVNLTEILLAVGDHTHTHTHTHTIQIEGKIAANVTKRDINVINQTRVSIVGDVSLPHNAITFDQALNIFITLPTLEGYGVPYDIQLTPISSFDATAQRVIRKINQHHIDVAVGEVRQLASECLFRV